MNAVGDEGPSTDVYRVGVDIGGTFTDIVFVSPDGAVITRKVSSTVDDYARGIIDGIGQVITSHVLEGIAIGEVMHGTTVASNAILEMTGARTGLITTRGFRDVLELRTLRMPRLYDLAWEKPPPLVERYLRMEVDERIDANGNIQREVESADIEQAVERLLAEGVEAIAVCLLNSFANPVHEQTVLEVLKTKASHIPCCISFDVLPEMKEYERTSTTVINAYLLPVVSSYLASLVRKLTEIGVNAPLLLMQSNGGLTTVEQAGRLPCHIIESGPAAGVVGAQALSQASGIDDVVSFDMGGTTAKASLIENGMYSRAVEYSVGAGIMVGSRLLTGAGYRLKVPAIDLAEVGAGGGSVVWLDAGGAMQIGPRSAGASPGPVCYGLGGSEPTVTDANVVLGYLNPDYLVGGELKIDSELSHSVLSNVVAIPLGIDLVEAAHGAHEIAAANMIRAVKAVSSERGRDPRSYAMVAFGGNGPLFAATMAKVLGMKRILIPPSPGVFSALGLLSAAVEHHYSRTLRRVLRLTDPLEFETGWQALETEARAQLAVDGFTPDKMALYRSANMHYQGQIYELSVPVEAGPFNAAAVPVLEEAFASEHERTYGHRAGPDEPVELVNLELVGRGLTEDRGLPIDQGDSCAVPANTGMRRAYFGRANGWIDTPVLKDRRQLSGADDGPLIIEEYDATCVVPPRARAALDDQGNILLTL